MIAKTQPFIPYPCKGWVSGSGARDASLRWWDGNERDGHENVDIPAGPPIDHDALLPGLRVRHDGWTQARTQRFLDRLAHTGCVTDAAPVADHCLRNGGPKLGHRLTRITRATRQQGVVYGPTKPEMADIVVNLHHVLAVLAKI